MDTTPAERFAAVLDLYEFAKRQMRANLRRRNPDLDDAELAELMAKWSLERRCAPHGDSAGTPRELNR